MRQDTRQLILNKAGENFIFRYAQGSEEKLFDAFSEKVKNKTVNFDNFDAAVLGYKLTQSLIKSVDRLITRNGPSPARTLFSV